MNDSRDKLTNIQIVFNLNEENIEYSVQQTMNLFDANSPYSFNLTICKLIYTAFITQMGEVNKYLG